MSGCETQCFTLQLFLITNFLQIVNVFYRYKNQMQRSLFHWYLSSLVKLQILRRWVLYSLTTAYIKYLSELLTEYTLARSLRSSSDPNILNVATTRTKSYGQRTFAYHEASKSCRHISSISRTKISKTFYFRFILL